MEFVSRLVHATNPSNCSAMPIHMGATNDTEYTRDSNPTITQLENAIADLEGSAEILPQHVSEAIQYRTLDRKLWV